MKSDLTLSHLLGRAMEALRHELHQYGEMLALLEQQRDAVMVRAAEDAMKSVVAIHQQMAAVQMARRERNGVQAEVAAALDQPKESSFRRLIPLIPVHYGTAVGALMAENSKLIRRVRRRAQLNHLLLSHSVDWMQGFLQALIVPTRSGNRDSDGRSVGRDQAAHDRCETSG